MLFIKVAETVDVSSEDSVEIPVESQGYILMSTLIAQFPGACGLKFKTEKSAWRGVRVVDDKLYPPGDDKWDSSCVYIITYPKDSKRKGDDLDINSAKSRKIERKCVDLIVLGIPWKSTEEVVRRYFEQYGEVVLCEIKRDSANNSKGFGFCRFKDYANQCSVLGKKHFIDGRWCDVKIPNSQEPETSRKIFVGRLSDSLTSKDLQDYFTQFGQVIDVYIPKPFRAFGFVTFVEADIAQSLCGESHIINGVSVHVSRADPKDDDQSNHGGHTQSHGKDSHQNHYHQGANHRNESYRKYSSNSQFSVANNNFNGNNYGGFKSSNHSRNKMKYDNSYHSLNSSETYDNRRSPNMHNHHHHHHNHANNNNNSNSANSSQLAMLGNNGMNPNLQNNDHMNAMMSVFNPMMAAFLQQLANGMQPLANSPTNNNIIDNVSHNLNGHHVPSWQPNNDYPRSNNGPSANLNGYNLYNNGNNGGGSNNTNNSAQYIKREKHF